MIPVTLLTGFLGSGKTTLLARLLKSPEFGRSAVIINEFGEVGIDHDLVAAAEESFVTLETGCICCMVRGDLEATLADLVARRMTGALPLFERIVIETSGLADPAPVINAVMSETGRGAGIVLDGVVTTVDAVTGAHTLDREAQAIRQVAVADRLIVTKTDLTGNRLEPRLAARLRDINPRAPVTTAIRGELGSGVLIGIGSVDALIPRAGSDEPTPAPRHNPSISSISIRRADPVPAVALTLFLEALADHAGADLLRLKGLIHVAEHPDRPAVIHGVQHVFHEPQWLAAWPTDDRSTRLVLIGKGLSQLWVQRLLDAIEAEVREIATTAAP
ncbi:MAG: GTP-binding protein [Hyphomicrobiaceae bacterium]